MAVPRVIGGVRIECDLFRRAGVSVQEQPDEQCRDGLAIVADPVIARGH